MARHEEPVFGLGHLHQREPHQRRSGQIEVLGLVADTKLVESRFPLVDSPIAQIHLAPGNVDAFEDDLHRRAVGILYERGPQILVPVEQRLRGCTQPVMVDDATEFQQHPHGVDVHRVGRDQCVEQQTRLQRGERPDVGETRLRDTLEIRFPRVDVVLRHRNQRHVRGRETSGITADDVFGQCRESLAPQVGEFGDVFTGQKALREGETRGQPWPVHRIHHCRVDIDTGVGRHIGITRRADVGENLGRQPRTPGEFLRDALGGNTSQVVEADLRLARR